MTTINTIEDLLRLLDENPEWVEALRARLLTRETPDVTQNSPTNPMTHHDQLQATRYGRSSPG